MGGELVFGADGVIPATSLTDGFSLRRSGANLIGTDIIKKSGSNTIVQDEGHVFNAGVSMSLGTGAAGIFTMTLPTDPNDGTQAFTITQGGQSTGLRLSIISSNGAGKPFVKVGRGGGTPLQTDLEVHGTLTLSVPTGGGGANQVACVGSDTTFNFGTFSGILGTVADKIGFYGHAGIAQQTLSTGAGHTVDDVITALQACGLVKQ